MLQNLQGTHDERRPRKVQRGQPLDIPASTYNAFVDAAQDYQRRKLNQQSTGLSSPRDADLVLVKPGRCSPLHLPFAVRARGG